MTKKKKQTLDDVRGEYLRVNALWNLANHREQVQLLKLSKLRYRGKDFTNAQKVAQQKLRTKIEGYAKERERLLKKIASLTEA